MRVLNVTLELKLVILDSLPTTDAQLAEELVRTAKRDIEQAVRGHFDPGRAAKLVSLKAATETFE